jgi:hypothetical protein
MPHLPARLEHSSSHFSTEETMKSILNRLREPSTWAGLSVLGAVFGLPPGTIDAVGQIIGGGAALLAIFMPEGKNA